MELIENEKLLEGRRRAEILLVDDQDKNLQVLGSYLYRDGYEVVFANSGEQALEVVKSGAPDLILLDVMMPGMDGYDVCRRLKSDPKTAGIPVIFITARIAAEDILAGFEAGGQDYIAKPVKPQELLARVKTHVELQLARTELAHSNENLRNHIEHQKHTFSILSHDLRGPVSTVGLLILELLQAVKGGSNQKLILEMLEDAHECTDRLTSLIADILDWSRVQMNAVRFDPQEFILEEAVQGVFLNQERNAERKGLHLVNHVASDCMVYADVNMVTTILRNLVSNAIKFTPRNGTITVYIQQNQEWATVYVQDTGVGMASEIIEKLFRMGEISSMQGTERESGTGLGLALCMGLVRKCGGQMTVTSEVGKGTLIGFTLSQAKP